MEGMPAGVHLVMEGINRHTEELMIAVGYRYSTRKTLSFIMTPGVDTTRKGTPSEMKYPTHFNNIGVRFVDHPDVLSKYFEDSNCVDWHNQARQFELHLGKCWVTMDPYFHLGTTFIGINITDCWKLGHYDSFFRNKKANIYTNNKEETMSTIKFAGILTQQLLGFATNLQPSPCFLCYYYARRCYRSFTINAIICKRSKWQNIWCIVMHH